jgi:hypothetical protein
MLIWNHIDKETPATNYPVLVNKEPVESLLDAQLAVRIKNREGRSGWFSGSERKIHTTEAMPYWTPLYQENVLLEKAPAEEEYPALLETYLSRLSLYEKRYQAIAKAMMAIREAYSLDYYIAGIINRSLSLVYGFETLIRSENFISAAHLVRSYLDCYFRLNAAYLVDDRDKFLMEVLRGNHVRKMMDRDGNLMTDAYLKSKATEHHPWMAEVYNETSGFVHFSNKHLSNAVRVSKEKENTLTTYIGKMDHEVTDESKFESVACMLAISNAIAEMCFGWVATKWDLSGQKRFAG